MRTHLFLFLLFCILMPGTLLGQTGLPTGTSTLFTGSGQCAVCHRAGSTGAMVVNNEDVSPITIWRSSMMGNASKDPLWRAVVSSEVFDNPKLQSAIENRCTRCHVPMGNVQAQADGNKGYSFEMLDQSSLDNDGVSCTACHQMTADKLGTDESYVGGFTIGNERTIFGPYEEPLTRPMQMHVRYTPAYGSHQVNRSEFCATCHTLFTNYIDYQGNISTELFPEQVPYLEWKNSVYPAKNTSCQSCHMSGVNEAVRISRMPMMVAARSPYVLHNFAGGNAFIPAVLRANSDELSVTAAPDDFDRTIATTIANLGNALDLNEHHEMVNDELNVVLTLENLSGHKLPTGHPFRRLWIHVTAKDTQGNILFESGNWDAMGHIVTVDHNFEPHHQVISDPNEVQIYQSVFTDVNGDVSTHLLRGKEYLKDNRIPPKGFTTQHADYTVAKIVGVLNDPDFNCKDGKEGSGTDEITYVIPADGETKISVNVAVCYQTTQPSIVESLITVPSIYTQAFLPMAEKNRYTPVIIKQLSFTTGE
jgi:hypothetical protein